MACSQLEKDAVFGIGGSTGGKGFAGVLLDSKNGTFTMGGQSGSATFATGKFHKVRLASDLRLRLRAGSGSGSGPGPVDSGSVPLQSLSDGCAGRCR